MKKQKTKNQKKCILGISPRAQEIFDTVVREFPDDIRDALDFAVLAQFAQSCDEIEQMNERIARDGIVLRGNKGDGINQAASARSMCYKSMLAAAVQLGLTPLARKNIKMKVAATAGRKKKVKPAEEEYL